MANARARTAAAAAVAGLLLTASACADTPPMVQPTAEVPTVPTDETPSPEPSEESTSDPSDSPDSGSADIIAPATDFDPCTVLTAEQVSTAVGYDVADGQSQEVTGTIKCDFLAPDGFAFVQWAPFPDGMDGAIEVVGGVFDVTEEPAEVTVSGSNRAVQVGVTVADQGSGRLIYVEVNGGYFQIGAMREGANEIDVIPLAELMLAESA
ncbi:DUF3558 family protein [Ruania alba]|uniref:DUF3558 domain-containing protein n=1 Tax=Ruania alba TaxID=648782 RepID=A0A1H5GUP1_9MICO|nr:DUF3558 domain-containing protein [Ruania alba]SEE18788.1 hypothetical protein SAMN04488554_1748 [Ruania alba]